MEQSRKKSKGAAKATSVSPTVAAAAAAPAVSSKKRTRVVEVEAAAPVAKKNKNKSPEQAAATAALTAPAITSARLDVEQVKRSVRALQTHVARASGGGLLDDDAPVHVLLALKHMPKPVGKARANKPVPLALPHPYVDLETADICVITKDDEDKSRFTDAGLKATVIGVTSLKKKYHPHQAKRELCKAHDIFLADARILPMLPPLLGKTFFEKRRLPVAVDLKKKDLRAELTRAACGALYRHSAGTSNSVQLGLASQSVEHLVANIVSGIEQLVERLPGKWTNIQSLQLRTTNSVALPFYNELPSQ